MGKGRVASSPLFLLRAVSGNKDIRVSAVAPVKIAKKAVVRNSTRRKIYDIIRPFINRLNAGEWVIIFARKDIRATEASILAGEIGDLFKKAKILNN